MNYNQLDPIYKKVMLGFSKKYTLYSDGCYVFSLAHRLGIDPIACHETLKAAGAFMKDNTGDVCLLNHAMIAKAFPDRVEGVDKYDKFDRAIFENSLKNYGGCIVKVDYDGTPSTVLDTHFVDFNGETTLFDSLGGKEKPQSTYPILTGMRIIKLKKISEDENMTDQEKQMLEFIRVNQMTEGQLREGYGYVKEGTVAKLNKKISDLETSQKSLQEQIDDLDGRFNAYQKTAKQWQSDLKTANETISNISKDLEVYKPYKSLYENKCKETVDKYTGMSLILIGIKKLLSR